MIFLEINPLSKPVAISEMVIILAISALVGWWIGRRMIMARLQGLRMEVANMEQAVSQCQEQTEVERREALTVMSAAGSDNLKLIEGIGPMIEKLLHQQGIYRFAQMADMNPSKLAQILEAGGSRFQMHDPSTWPEQAALARDAKWDDLGDLQDRLDGGRRI